MRLLLLAISFFWAVDGLAQVPDSLADERFLSDTSAVITNAPTPAPDAKAPKGIRKFFQSNYPSPLKSALFSLVVPGAGQIYNKKFWKVPIVYTGVGSIIYFIGKNTNNYQRWRTAYRERVDGDDNTVDEFVDLYPTADRLKTIRDGYRKRMEQSYIGLVVVLVLSSADAFVDAHLLNFDINDDLSLKVTPKLTPIGNTRLSPGIGLRFTLAN